MKNKSSLTLGNKLKQVVSFMSEVCFHHFYFNFKLYLKKFLKWCSFSSQPVPEKDADSVQYFHHRDARHVPARRSLWLPNFLW